MKRIFLHIGMHKTGTTSIQFFCKDHAEDLKRQGYFVVTDAYLFHEEDANFPLHLPGMLTGDPWRTNCFRLAHLIIRKELETIIRLKGNWPTPDEKQTRYYLALARERLKTITEPNIILSSEAFSFIRTDAEMKLLEHLFAGFDLKTICFFREKVAWMESWKAQVVKAGLGGLISHRSDGIFDFDPQSWLSDYDALKRLFGKNAIYFDYDACCVVHNNVIPAFLLAIEFEANEITQQDQYWLNASGERQGPMA